MKDLCITTTIHRYQWDELSEQQQVLIEEAKRMTRNSYSPYSHFRVGAAVRLKDGTIVRGSNQENAAYPSGLCAERTALFAANANYPDQPVEALAIACYAEGQFTSEPGAPCAGCRQVMLETEHRYGQPIQVLLYGQDVTYVIDSVDELVPLGFFAEDLPKH